MQFQRLRLSGFKSFVDVAEFRIEPGLTAIVGPNGCGKSNLLEALRWVMGANSARAMRAEGMDDVIFGGSGARPSRNHAEVRLEIDNADRTAPARFNDHAVLEVVRRIDRGAGSTYRVNGVETRARDVQLLFADASTGANSPALVRQGQISELIGAKPSNRRRLLEEAAGVSGLHTRRHEADLRLKAAGVNLDRLEDVARELETALNRMRREARQAERYRRLSADIRNLKGAALYARWLQASAARAAAHGADLHAQAAVSATAGAAARAATAAAEAAAALPSLREEVQVAAAVWQRLTIEADRVEREAEQAHAEVQRLRTDRARIAGDMAREADATKEAAGALERLGRDLADLDAQIAAAPERLPHLAEALTRAEGDRAHADAAVERAAGAAAAEAAGRRAAMALIEQAQATHAGAAARLAAAHARLDRVGQTLAGAAQERSVLSMAADPFTQAAATALSSALADLQHARSQLEAAEVERVAAQAAESAERKAARSAEDQLGRLKAQAQGLAQLTRSGRKDAHPPALDAVRAERGYEQALAAALGDDLDAALDPAAAAHWAGAAVASLEWPAGAAPLAVHVEAPPQLAARLVFVAVVERAEGSRLRAAIPVGGRLVSREGDLWRWDGFTVRSEAPKPAAQRLAQRARLLELEAEIAALIPAEDGAASGHRQAVARLRTAEEALKAGRPASEAAERAVAAAREQAQAHARDAARREARVAALDETITRLTPERDEAQAAAATARSELQAARATLEQAQAEAGTGERAPPRLGGELTQARVLAARARDAESRARAALDAERRAFEGRGRRRDAVLREQGDWSRRAQAGAARIRALEVELLRAQLALDAALARPAAADARREQLLGGLATAQTRRALADDVLASAEGALMAADREARATEQAAGQAREARAVSSARIEAAETQLLTAADQVRKGARMEPQALGRRIAGEAVSVPADPAAVESHLAALERDRDRLGAVNLRAEEEAAELGARLDTLRHERADLRGAIGKLNAGVQTLNAEGRERLLAAFAIIDGHFRALFDTLFEGGQAELRLVEADDPLEAGLEIYACPPGKRLATMSLMSGGEQALTATALIFAVFLANPAPVCVLDEVDAPLDDANVDRFCRLLDEMRRRTQTRFIAITHNPVTMSRMDRLFGVTMAEPGVSQLVSVDLRQAEALAAE